MEIDQQLLWELELAVDGTDIHRALNFRGIYLGAIAQFKETGKQEWEEFAREVEADLRAILRKHRYAKAGLVSE